MLLGDISEKALAAAKEKLEYSGYAVETMQVDASDKASIYAFAKKAAELGPGHLDHVRAHRCAAEIRLLFYGQ